MIGRTGFLTRPVRLDGLGNPSYLMARSSDCINYFHFLFIFFLQGANRTVSIAR